MHIENFTQLFDFFVNGENNVQVYSLIVLFVTICAIIIVVKNYFYAMKKVYAKSKYKSAHFICLLDKVFIVMFFMSPIFLACWCVFNPYGFKINDEEIIITDYSGTSQNVEIPSTILFKDVKEIAEEAFSENNNIEKVIIPNTITRIGEFAFAGCNNLSDVSGIENNVSIGTGAFLNTRWLYDRDEDYIIVGNQHYIYVGTSRDVKVPENVKTIDFYQNKTIQRIVLPESLEYFSEYCLQGCSSLYSMSMPPVHWGAYCFGGCDRLTVLEGPYDKLSMHGDIRAYDVNTPHNVDENFVDNVRHNIQDDADYSLSKSYKALYLEKLTEFINNQYSRFELYDLNTDRMPELFISDDSSHIAGVKIYTVINNNLIDLGDGKAFGAYGTIYAVDGGYLLATDINRGYIYNIYYKFDGKSIIRIEELWNNCEAVADESQYEYKINGNTVSIEEYNKVKSKYDNYKWKEVGRKYNTDRDTIYKVLN